MIQTKQHLKRSLQIKTVSTLQDKKAHRSIPDMFNFYVVLAGPDKVSDAGRATTFRRKFKAPSLQTKSTKKGEASQNEFHEKSFDDFRKKQKTLLSLDETTP